MAKEYIEREALFRTIENIPDNELLGNDNTTFVELSIVLDIISEQPTADVQEVRHASWEYFFDIEEMARCSNCYEVLKKGRASCYCPHCGAKMDKE